MSFTDPAVKVRRELVVHFEINSIDVTTRHLDCDYISLTKVDDDATSPVKTTETILSNEVGEKL